jgi:UDP-glucose 4-epimerase
LPANEASPLRGLASDRAILVTGGTGSLGTALVERLISGRHGLPARIVIFSRDEAKQHELRQRWLHQAAATDDAIWRESARRVQFRVGDVRDAEALGIAAQGIDTLVHAAALKQVPTCEYFPEEAVRTNVLGAENIVRTARRSSSLRTVIGISTDKAVKPVNVMGMTKSLQERIIARANLDLPECRFSLVRYGNVIASRGSVLPLFLDQAAKGGPLTVTDPAMTRFLLTLDDAVDVVMRALSHAGRGVTLVPRLPSVRVIDLARAVVDGRSIDIQVTGIRPGEKIHEVLISEEERPRTKILGNDYAVESILPEIGTASGPGSADASFDSEYSSADSPVDAATARRILESAGVLQPAFAVA